MQLFDQSWKDHLLHLDHLRQGIGLRAYGQKDPLNEYKREAFNLFNDLLTGLREQVVSAAGQRCSCAWSRRRCRRCRRADARGPRGSGAGQPAAATIRPSIRPIRRGGGVATLQRPRTAKPPSSIPTIPSTWGKVSRNAPCPCGSGKKFKHCHGRVEPLALREALLRALG